MYWFVLMSGEKNDIWEDDIEYFEFDNADDAWDTHKKLVEHAAPDLVTHQGYTEVIVQTIEQDWKDRVVRETTFFRDGAVNDIVF